MRQSAGRWPERHQNIWLSGFMRRFVEQSPIAHAELAARIATDLLLRTEEMSAPSPAAFAKMVAAARDALEPTGAGLLLAEVFTPLLAKLAPLGAHSALSTSWGSARNFLLKTV